MNSRIIPPLDRQPGRPKSRRIFLAATTRVRRRALALAWVSSAAVHLMVLAALFWPPGKPVPDATPPAPLPVTLVDLQPEPQAPPGPAGPPSPAPARASGPPHQTQPAPRAPVPAFRPMAHAAPAPSATAAPMHDDMSDVLNDSELAGASDADGNGEGGGAGGGGGGCDTARIVQQALRRDPLVRTAVEDAHRLGKAVMLWNGDWVRSGVQEGKGLSAVREAIIWELAFTPTACRDKPVHGVVLLSLADGNTRFAIGGGSWRWSDLLDMRAAASDR